MLEKEEENHRLYFLARLTSLFVEIFEISVRELFGRTRRKNEESRLDWPLPVSDIPGLRPTEFCLTTTVPPHLAQFTMCFPFSFGVNK